MPTKRKEVPGKAKRNHLGNLRDASRSKSTKSTSKAKGKKGDTYAVRKLPVRLEKPIKVSAGTTTASVEFGSKCRLPLTPKRPDRKSVAGRRESGQAVSLDKRLRKPVYLKAIKRLLVKTGHLIERNGQYKIPLSEEKELDDYAVTFTFRFTGIGHDDKKHTHLIPAVVRLLTHELEAAVNVEDYQVNMLARAYRHAWFGPAYTFFRSGGIRSIFLDSLQVDRLSLSEIKTKESKLRSVGRRNVRNTAKMSPKELFGNLRRGKKYYPNGFHKNRSGIVWVVESRKIKKRKRLVIVERYYLKNGNKSKDKRSGKILWKP